MCCRLERRQQTLRPPTLARGKGAHRSEWGRILDLRLGPAQTVNACSPSLWPSPARSPCRTTDDVGRREVPTWRPPKASTRRGPPTVLGVGGRQARDALIAQLAPRGGTRPRRIRRESRPSDREQHIQEPTIAWDVVLPRPPPPAHLLVGLDGPCRQPSLGRGVGGRQLVAAPAIQTIQMAQAATPQDAQCGPESSERIESRPVVWHRHHPARTRAIDPRQRRGARRSHRGPDNKGGSRHRHAGLTWNSPAGTGPKADDAGIAVAKR